MYACICMHCRGEETSLTDGHELLHSPHSYGAADVCLSILNLWFALKLLKNNLHMERAKGQGPCRLPCTYAYAQAYSISLVQPKYSYFQASRLSQRGGTFQQQRRTSATLVYFAETCKNNSRAPVISSSLSHTHTVAPSLSRNSICKRGETNCSFR